MWFHRKKYWNSAPVLFTQASEALPALSRIRTKSKKREKQVELSCFRSSSLLFFCGASWWLSNNSHSPPKNRTKKKEKMPLVINWKWCSYENNNKSDFFTLPAARNAIYSIIVGKICLTYGIDNTAQIRWFFFLFHANARSIHSFGEATHQALALFAGRSNDLWTKSNRNPKASRLLIINRHRKCQHTWSRCGWMSWILTDQKPSNDNFPLVYYRVIGLRSRKMGKREMKMCVFGTVCLGGFFNSFFYSSRWFSASMLSF